MTRDDRGKARARTTLAALLVSLLSTACSGVLAKGDGRAIGDDLGRFHIDAKLTSTSCGAGAEGQPADFRLEVFLSEAPPYVYWNTGADSVEGSLASDGVHFTFRSQTIVAIPGDESAAATCTIVRTDHSSGAFDDPARVQKLAGVLEYDYAPQGQSDCSTAMATQGFAALPCRMKYSMTGTWFSAR